MMITAMRSMILTGLLAVAARGGIQAIAPGALLDPTVPGREFVDLLAKGEFAAAEARLDTTMKGALPETRLRETWQTVVQQAGAYQTQLRARITDQAGYKMVLVTCQFEKAALDVRVVFDTQGRVAGLFFAPAPPEASAFKTPPYARTDAYTEMEFTVGTGEWKLPGTLTMPKGALDEVPVVILVHGSGPGDRDGTVGTNKPFRDLAWGLASRGVAVLRYEKRTRQHAVKLVAQGLAGLTLKEEAIDDAVAAAGQLRTTQGIDPKRVFVLGHSLGATIAPRIAQADGHLAGLVLLAAASRPFEDLTAEQLRYLASLGAPLSREQKAAFDQALEETARIKRLTPADRNSATLVFHAPPSYWLDLREHDTLALARELQLPLLVLQGGRDCQVTEADFAGWKTALDGRPNATFKLFPDLNHLFIKGVGKSKPAEYEMPGNMDESVVREIGDWILQAPAAR